MIKVHHLGYSRSTRVIWLLEEMGVPYEMEHYHRDAKTRRSPPELGAVHALSKAPTVGVDGHIMVESGAILEYLVERAPDCNLSYPVGTPERASYLEWLHFAEGTLGMSTLLKILGPNFGGLPEPLGQFVDGEIATLYDYLEVHLQGRSTIVGEYFSAADINVEYLLELAMAAGVLQDRPNITAYLEGLQARPAYQKAIEIGGPILPPGRG